MVFRGDLLSGILHICDDADTVSPSGTFFADFGDGVLLSMPHFSVSADSRREVLLTMGAWRVGVRDLLLIAKVLESQQKGEQSKLKVHKQQQEVPKI